MLYEGAIRFVQQAHDAIEQNDTALRHEKLKRAGDIVAALQSAIDTENGGALAQGLFEFYANIGNQILKLHRNANVTDATCTVIIHELRSMRDMWDAIDREKSA